MAAGRPKKFNTAAEMQEKLNEYFCKCDDNKKEVVTKDGDVVKVKDKLPYTIEGLCVALGMDRRSLLNYAKEEEFFHTVKEAKLKVQHNMTEMALKGNANSTLAIFLLKNNYGYKDKTEQEIDMKAEVKIGTSLKEFYDEAGSED